MAHSLVDHVGNTTTPSVTGTVGTYVVGPSPSGAAKMQGLWIWQSGSGTSKTLRWIGDSPCATTPSGYTAV